MLDEEQREEKGKEDRAGGKEREILKAMENEGLIEI